VVSKKEKFKRVIFVWNYLEWGGAQIYFLSIIKNAPPEWRFTIVLPANSKPELIRFFEPYKVEFDFIEPQTEQNAAETVSDKLKRQQRRIAGEREIYRHLLKYDLANAVVHIEVAPWQSWILLYFLSLKTNVFVTMHNALPENVPNWRKKLWKTRLNFIFSRPTFHQFAANQNAIDSLKNFIKPKFWNKLILSRASINVTEIEKIGRLEIDREAARRNLNLPESKFIVLCVGQFIDRKGRWVFLESVREISALNRDVFFVWLTQQKPNETDQRKIDEFEINDSFRLVLSKSIGKKHDEVLRFFRLFDAFALPSFWEGLPIAVLEAMALGVPTISTRVNAIPEAVIDMKTGLLIEAGSAEQLSKAILKLYADENLRKSLSKAGRAFVLDNFDESVAGRIVLENYEKCLAK
jgi:glycosyltransferase involved in cell wall biosynthesis